MRNAPHRDPWSSGGTGKPVPMAVPRGRSRVPLTRRMPVTAPAIQSCIYRMPTRVCGFLLCLGGAQRHRACRGVCGRRESRVVSGDCLEMGWCAVMSRFGVGVCAAMGWCAVMSRICVGVCHGCADWAVFSRFGLLGCFSRIADFQRSCWEFVRWMADSLQSPALDVGVCAGIGKIRQFSRKNYVCKALCEAAVRRWLLHALTA